MVKDFSKKSLNLKVTIMSYMKCLELPRVLLWTILERLSKSWPSNIILTEEVMLTSLRKSMLLMRFYLILRKGRLTTSMDWKVSKVREACLEDLRIFSVSFLVVEEDMPESKKDNLSQQSLRRLSLSNRPMMDVL